MLPRTLIDIPNCLKELFTQQSFKYPIYLAGVSKVELTSEGLSLSQFSSSSSYPLSIDFCVLCFKIVGKKFREIDAFTIIITIYNLTCCVSEKVF
jgi:hypothetical protein